MEFEIGQVVNFFYDDSKLGKAIAIRNYLVWGSLGWTHSGIISKVKNGIVTIHEAGYSGFTKYDYKISGLTELIKQGIISIGKPEKELTDVEKTCKALEGRPYGFMDLFNILFVTLFKRKATKLSGPRKLICSEAVAHILYTCSKNKIDLSKEFGIPFDYIEPMHLYNSKQINWEFTIW